MESTQDYGVEIEKKKNIVLFLTAFYPSANVKFTSGWVRNLVGLGPGTCQAWTSKQ